MAEGQFTGSRSKYVYTMDGGQDVILTLDDTLAALSTTLTAFNPASPGTAVPAPRRFKPRVVFWEGTAAGFEGKRKAIVVGDTSDTIYATQTGAALTVDGVAGRTTGRRGEKLTF